MRKCPVCSTKPVCSTTAGVSKSVKDRYGIPLNQVSCECGMVYHLNSIPSGFYEGGPSSPYRQLIAWHRGEAFDWEEHLRDQWTYATALANFLEEYGGESLAWAHVGADGEHLDPIAETLTMRTGSPCRSISDWENDTLTLTTGVAICRTIEHLEDPRGLLAACMRLPSASLVYVDALMSNVRKLDHIYYFQEKTLKRLTKDLGFDIVASSYTIGEDHYSLLLEVP